MPKNVDFPRKKRKKSQKNSITDDFMSVFEFLYLIFELVIAILNPLNWFKD